MRYDAFFKSLGFKGLSLEYCILFKNTYIYRNESCHLRCKMFGRVAVFIA